MNRRDARAGAWRAAVPARGSGRARSCSLKLPRSSRLCSSLALLCALAVACSGEADRASPGSSPEDEGSRDPAHGGGLRLLDHLEDFDVELDEELLDGGPTVVLAEDFTEPLAGGWYDDRARRRGRAGVGVYSVVTEEPEEGRPVLALMPQALCLNHELEFGDAFAVRVLVRWRRMEEEGPLPRLALTALDDAGAPFDGESDREVRTKTLGGSPSRWSASELEIRPLGSARSVRLQLFPGAGVWVDRLRVEALGALDTLAGPARGELADFGRSVHIQSVTAEAMVLPAGSSWTLPVTVPHRAPRLNGWTAFAGGPGQAAVEVFVGDRRLGRDEVVFDSPRATREFKFFSFAIEQHAGLAADLRIEVRGDPGVTAIWGAPRLMGRPEQPPGAIVLFSVDTLRPDVLSCYGGIEGISPNIDRLARGGVLYEDAVSSSSFTLPTHASLFTGQDPLAHRTYSQNHRLDPRRSFLLARELRDRGWATAAFTAGGNVDPHFGFAQGFDYYDTIDPGGGGPMFGGSPESRESWYPSADQQTRRLRPVLRWLEAHRDQPFFLFVHTYFVHNYVVEPSFLERVGAEVRPDDDLRELWSAAKHGDEEATSRMREYYLASVAQVDDRVVKPLLQRLDHEELVDRLTTVLLSDHGEEFGEHAGIGHGRTLWSELVEIPLVVRGPGFPFGTRVKRRVGIIDVAPTLALGAGLPADHRWTGRSLNATGEVPAFLHFVSRDGRRRWDGWIDGSWKFLRVQDNAGTRRMLFDLDQDSGETRDLASEHGDTIRGLERRLDQSMGRSRSWAAVVPDAEETELDADLEAHLRALGYLDDEADGGS